MPDEAFLYVGRTEGEHCGAQLAFGGNGDVGGGCFPGCGYWKSDADGAHSWLGGQLPEMCLPLKKTSEDAVAEAAAVKGLLEQLSPVLGNRLCMQESLRF